MRAWLASHDPGLAVVRRAVRVSVATCVAFYLGVYLLDDSTVGLFGAFTCVALGGLSEVSGTPGRRATTLVLGGGVGAGLIALGTLLSVSTLAATAGMVVVGFVVSFAGIGGPRVAGLSNGWQLLYILPSFPPYDPGSLGSRLLGLATGLVLLVVADRWLLPARTPVPYHEVLATAVAAVGERLAVVRPLLAAPATADVSLASSADDTWRAVDSARLSAQPLLQRPSGPSRHHRALWEAASATRMLAARVDDLAGAVRAQDEPAPHRGDAVLGAAQQCVEQSAAALRGGLAPDVAALDAELARALELRSRWLVEAVGAGGPLHDRVVIGTATHEVAAAALDLGTAVTVATTVRRAGPSLPVVDERFWFASAGVVRLGAVRLRGQLTFRSVWFRNALRVALALGLARALAGVLDLEHGFWVLLATLTLMRTTFTATRTTVTPAVLGTLVGAAVAVPLLVVLGDQPAVLAVLLPFLVAGAFAGGPLLGPAYGQAGFTLTVAALFAQVAPASWSLAEWRLVDVTLGALIGVSAGLLAWPRGASGQLLSECRDALHRSGAALLATARVLTARVPVVDPDAVQDVVRTARRSLLYAGETVAFAMTEPVASAVDAHWRDLLDACHHMVDGGEDLRLRRQGLAPLGWTDAVDVLDRLAADAARRADEVADALPGIPGAVPPRPDAGIGDWLRDTVTGPVAPPGALDVIDARGWLVAVRRDLDRAVRA